MPDDGREGHDLGGRDRESIRSPDLRFLEERDNWNRVPAREFVPRMAGLVNAFVAVWGPAARREGEQQQNVGDLGVLNMDRLLGEWCNHGPASAIVTQTLFLRARRNELIYE